MISSSVKVCELEIGDELDVLDELSDDDTSAVEADTVSAVEVDADPLVVAASVLASEVLSVLEAGEVELEVDVVEDDELDELELDELDELVLDELDELVLDELDELVLDELPETESEISPLL